MAKSVLLKKPDLLDEIPFSVQQNRGSAFAEFIPVEWIRTRRTLCMRLPLDDLDSYVEIEELLPVGSKVKRNDPIVSYLISDETFDQIMYAMENGLKLGRHETISAWKDGIVAYWELPEDIFCEVRYLYVYVVSFFDDLSDLHPPEEP